MCAIPFGTVGVSLFFYRPGTDVGKHTRNPQLDSYLLDMVQTQHFKGISSPSIFGSVLDVGPKMCVRYILPAQKLLMIKAKQINKLVNCAFFPLALCRICPYKTTFAKIVDYGGQYATVAKINFLLYFFEGQAFVLFRQCLHHLPVHRR